MLARISSIRACFAKSGASSSPRSVPHTHKVASRSSVASSASHTNPLALVRVQKDRFCLRDHLFASSAIPVALTRLTRRGYVLSIAAGLRKKKKLPKLRKEKGTADLKLPDALRAQMGDMTRDDLDTILASEPPSLERSSTRKSKLLEAMEEVDDSRHKPRALAEDEDEFEDEEWEDDDILDENQEPLARFVRDEDDWAAENEIDEEMPETQRKRIRSPPPYAPGRVILDPDNWTTDTQDSLVEYQRKNEDGSFETVLGLVRRPRGQRTWGIQNITSESEDRVNVYKISYQWPPNEHGQFAKTLEEARELQAEADTLYSSIDKNPFYLWKHFVSTMVPKQRHRIVLPRKDGILRASAVHVMPADMVKPTPRRRDRVPTRIAMEEKPDDLVYIDITVAACKLFSLEKTEITPSHLYATHRFLATHVDFFETNIHRGFICREPSMVHDKLKQRELAEKQKNVREGFVNKLLPILARNRQLAILKDSDPVLSYPEPQVQVQEGEIEFTSQELVFLADLKKFALSGDQAEDADLGANILAPLGFGDRPHHAFELLSELNLISKFDNPHLLRWEGPLGFKNKDVKLASEIVELTDGDQGALLADFDEKTRVDFSGVPTFAIDSATALEVDDAISLYVDEQHREWVYVHITDVHRYVLPNSVLDLEARERVASIFLPDTSFGIFPDIMREHLSLGGKNMAPDYEKEEKNLEDAFLTSPKNTPTIKYQPPTSPLDKQASLMGSSASRIIGALVGKNNSSTPSSVTTSALSEPEVAKRGKQPTLSFGALIDGGGKVEEWRVVNGYISDVKRITYDQLNEILAPKADPAADRARQIGNAQPQGLLSAASASKSIEDRLEVSFEPLTPAAALLKKDHYITFIRLMDIATKRRSYRLDNRAIVTALPTPEVSVKVDEAGRATAHIGVSDDFNKNARGLVQEYMLLAGQVAGLFSRENRLPMFYLTQDVKRQEHDRSMLDYAHAASILSVNPKSKAPEIIKNLGNFRALKPAILSTMPTSNEAQGLPVYVTVTSPLRRYVDLIAHYQIKAALRQENPPFSLRQLHDLGTPLQSRRTEVSALMRNANRFWILGCLAEMTKTDKYKKFKALVTDAKSLRSNDEATLMLLDFALENNITATRTMLKGETIWVRVDMVNPFYDTLILKEVRNPPKVRSKKAQL